MSRHIYWVCHTHWDREWYRTFQAFRARLVDTVDAVLELIATDPGFRFVLDGQTVVLEDYLAIRPDRSQEIRAACQAGRLGIGPWYVQPDSLLPAGEAHVRNLLIGRTVGEAFGPVSQVAYTPDSFGHPAQFPQLFAGFGLATFVYWRGNGNEVDQLPAEYRWVAPDGSAVTACLLWNGYFNGAMLPALPARALPRLVATVDELGAKSGQDAVLIMNGIDHAPPRHDAVALAHLLATETAEPVTVSLLDDFAAAIGGELPEYRGELIGARVANLLPGVWSARLPLKLMNRRCETALCYRAEPWAAFAPLFGLHDERPALRAAWKALLKNQAHDSIGGCSIDGVHRQMLGRYDTAAELANETARRVLERLAGQPPERHTPVGEPFEVAVFNPSPRPRSGFARLHLDAHPSLPSADEGAIYHPVLAANYPGRGYSVDGVAIRAVHGNSDGRFFFDDTAGSVDLEIPVREVPPFGCVRVRVDHGNPVDVTVDDGTTIGNDSLRVALEEGGTVTLGLKGRHLPGLFAIEERADRGDSYDADLLAADDRCELVRVKHTRRRWSNGVEELDIERLYRVPRGLEADRRTRSVEETGVRLFTTLRIDPDSDELRVGVQLKNTAEDHRLRLLFPTGAPVDEYSAATTFATAVRSTAPVDDSGWLHPAPTTFPQQGWVSANDLTVVAPGLTEAEVSEDGVIALTLVRSVGWLSRHDLDSRPGPAGPVIPAAEAQCLETIAAQLTLFEGIDPVRAQACEMPLAAVFAGPEPLLQPGRGLLALDSESLLLSACKPAEQGDGIIVRLLNPGAAEATGTLTPGFSVERAEVLRLDERPVDGAAVDVDSDGRIRLALGPAELLTLRLA